MFTVTKYLNPKRSFQAQIFPHRPKTKALGVAGFIGCFAGFVATDSTELCGNLTKLRGFPWFLAMSQKLIERLSKNREKKITKSQG